MPKGYLDISLANPYFWAALVAAIVGFWRQHLLTTIIVGMIAFILLKWITS